MRLAHISDVNLTNKTIKECEEIIEEQNDLLEDLWEEREALLKPRQTLLEIQNNQSKERFNRFKTKITDAGFKPRILFKEA